MSLGITKAAGVVIASVVMFGVTREVTTNQMNSQIYTINPASAITRMGGQASPDNSFTTTPTPSTGNSTGTDVTNTSSVNNVTSNWAGYVSTGGTYTSITGSWTVPTVNPTSQTTAADATWIGIGGVSGSDLIQIGTQDVMTTGTVSTETFYEELPAGSETVPGVSVRAGDVVDASIDEVSAGNWTLTIKDMTTGESYTNTVAYNSAASSAEWIEEAPSDETSVIPLDNFGIVSFNDATTRENGKTVTISASDAKAFTMDNDAEQALTNTSALNTDGTSFSVSRTAATASNSSDEYSQLPHNWIHHERGYRNNGNLFRG
jgi:hypothetical protein